MSAPKLTFGGILRSEWIKLFSLRSTWWCFGISIVVTVGIASLIALASGVVGEGLGGDQEQEARQRIGVIAATYGIGFGLLAIAVLGVLVIAGEYSTGQIRSTFAAAPGRVAPLLGKALMFTLVTLLVSVLTIGLSVAATLLILAANGVQVDVTDPNYLWALAGGVGYLTLIGALALFLGAIVKVPAGGIAAIIGLVLVLPQVLNIVAAVSDQPWAHNLTLVLPSSAGSAMTSYPDTQQFLPDGWWALEPWHGAVLLAAWVVVAGIVATIIVKRRDV